MADCKSIERGDASVISRAARGILIAAVLFFRIIRGKLFSLSLILEADDEERKRDVFGWFSSNDGLDICLSAK